MSQKTSLFFQAVFIIQVLWVLPLPGMQTGLSTDSLAVLSPDLMDIEGTLVCVTEEMAKYQKKKTACDKYGHVIGLLVSDGTIWTFYPNPLQRELRDNGKFISRSVKIRGRFFYSGKIIEIVSYKFLPSPQTSSES